MTARKPPRVSVTTWVERQIRDAQNRGVFDDLPGKGKPIPGLDRPWDSLTWVAALLHREDLPLNAVLPAALALAKEVEDLPARLAVQRSEAAVREIVEDLNQRIRQAHRRPQVGPPLTVMPRDVEKTVAAWRASRP
jgi:Domain of unknown function (DUF1992)